MKRRNLLRSGATLGATLVELLGSGLSLETVLPAFTVNVAEVLGLGRKGRIAVDADADLLVLDGQGNVQDVMARGRWHVRDGSVMTHGTFERAGHRRGEA